MSESPTEGHEAAAKIAELFGVAADSEVFVQALVHPSYANERSVPHNQRLEFLGDAVLGLCASELLFQRFPQAAEGDMTRMRAHLVNAEALAEWARRHGLAEAVCLGRGAAAGRLRESTNVLADAVEALIAAAFLDGGLEVARKACERVVQRRLDSAESVLRDPKSELQERVQANGQVAPTYEVIGSWGPAHDRCFRVRVDYGQQRTALGEGRSKRLAERAAATEALQAMGPSRGQADTDG